MLTEAALWISGSVHGLYRTGKHSEDSAALSAFLVAAMPSKHIAQDLEVTGQYIGVLIAQTAE